MVEPVSAVACQTALTGLRRWRSGLLLTPSLPFFCGTPEFVRLHYGLRRDVEDDFLVVADQRDRQLHAGIGRDHAHEIVEILDLFVADLDDPVAGPDAGLSRRTIGQHFADIGRAIGAESAKEMLLPEGVLLHRALGRGGEIQLSRRYAGP